MRSLILFFFLSACASPSITPWYLPSGKIKNPFFYSLKKENKHWYLIGTHHWLGIEELPEVIVKTFKKVPVTVFESVDTRSKSPSFQRTADDRRLSILTWETLLESGMPKATINKYNNAFLCYLFLRPVSLPVSMDSSFLDMARKKGNKLVGLEKTAEADAIEAKYDDSTCDLEKTVREDQTKGVKIHNQFLEDYRKGVYDLLEDRTLGSGYKSVAERNKIWHRSLEALNEKQAFIIIGAGHLGGDTGLLKFFEDQGWDLERIVQ